MDKLSEGLLEHVTWYLCIQGIHTENGKKWIVDKLIDDEDIWELINNKIHELVEEV